MAALIGNTTAVAGDVFLRRSRIFFAEAARKRLKTIAGACGPFILAYALSDLTWRLMKLENTSLNPDLMGCRLLLPAMFIGGQIGAFVAAGPLPAAGIKRLTGVLIIYVAGRLLLRW